MKKDPGKVLIGVDIVQLQDHVDTLKGLDKCNVLNWESTKALVFITDILDNVAMCEEDLPLEPACKNCTFYRADYGYHCFNGWTKDGRNGYCHLKPERVPVRGVSKCGQFSPKC